MWKTTSYGVEVYAYDEAGRRIGSYFVHSSSPNNIQTQEELLYWDNWRLVGSVRPDPALGMTSPIVYPVLSDHLGSPRKVLDPTTGYTRWDWDAKEPFGMQAPNENPSSAGGFVFNARFPGQWFDNETGFYHNGFRYYDPSLGRYTQSDPLGLEAGWNTYAYVGNNPLGGVDYFGLVKDIIYSTGETREICQYIFWCAKFLVIEMETDIGNRFRAYKYLEGYQGYQNNCHSYGLNLPKGIWVDNPAQILKDEYHKVNTETEADILVFRQYNSQTQKYTYNHTSIVREDINRGKNGIWREGKDPKIFHPFGEKIFYRKNNDE